jgi:stearoyl-CoA desaturase (delta-9 desaturase)
MAKHEYPSTVHYVPDLLRDRAIVKVDKYYYYWIALGLLLPAAIDGLVHHSWVGALNGFLWGGVVRMFLLGHIIWSINSFLHRFGPRLFATPEHSRNGPLFSLVTLGESWHNNHHAFPNSASFGLTWYRLDPGFWLIKLLEGAGLASGVKVPTKDRIRTKQAMTADVDQGAGV